MLGRWPHGLSDILVTCLLQLIFREKCKFYTLYYCNHLHQQVRFTVLKYIKLWKTAADFGRSRYLTVWKRRTLVADVVDNRWAEHPCGSRFPRSLLLLLQPLWDFSLLSLVKTKEACVSGVPLVLWLRLLLLEGEIIVWFFLIAKSPLVIIQWLSGKSYDCRVFLFVYPSFRSTLWFDTGAGNALWEHSLWPAISRTSQILPHCYTVQSLLHVTLCQMLNLPNLDGGITAHLRHPVIILKHCLSKNAVVEVFLGWKNYRGELVLFSIPMFVGSVVNLRQSSVSPLLQTDGTLSNTV